MSTPYFLPSGPGQNVAEMSWPGAERLKQLLSSRNRRQVAQELGIHYTTLMGYQAGRRAPDVANLIALCRYLDVSADDLLGLHPSGTAVAEASSAHRQSTIHRLEDENVELRRLTTQLQVDLRAAERALATSLTTNVIEAAKEAVGMMAAEGKVEAAKRKRGA